MAKLLKEVNKMDKKQMSSQALCAKQIRTELKVCFPSIKFKVKSESFAGGNSVHISWENGPTDEIVSKITNKYQYGHFDGMIDCYEYSNKREDISQAKYVQTNRNITPDIELQAAKVLKKHLGGLEDVYEPFEKEDLYKSFTFNHQYYNWSQLVYRFLNKIDLTNSIGIKENPDFESGSMFEGFIAIKKDD